MDAKVEHGVEDEGVANEISSFCLRNKLCETHDVIHKSKVDHFIEDLDFC